MPHGTEWLKVVAMACLTAGAFVCLLASLRRVGALRNSIIGAIEPLAVALLGATFLAEPIHASTAVGGGLILVGSIAAAIARSKTPADAPAAQSPDP